MPLRTLDLYEDIGDTLVTPAFVEYLGRRHEVLVKHESSNPTGSIKDRTAVGLLASLQQRAPLHPGTVVIESTSGNLGLGLARLLTRLDCRLVAVIDPKTPEATRRRLEAAGVELHCIDEPDGRGGYLLSRLRAVEELCQRNPGYRWTDQYNNEANPEIHRRTTGPEIIRQGGPDLDVVYAAVSTGGTLAGISAYLNTLNRRIEIVAVDSAGSLVTGEAQGRRYLAGIGASRPSSFLKPDAYHRAARVADDEAIAVCRMVLADTGLYVGGSSGSVIRAYLSDLAGGRAPRLPMCLCPDGGEKYTDTVYSDDWLALNGVAESVEQTIVRLRNDGLTFHLE